jgi:predicted dienelactone hydrolase
VRPAARTAVALALALAAGVPDPGRAAEDLTAPGPYRVGRRIVDFEKSSETTGAPRRLRTAIWYPAEGSAGGVTDDVPVRPGRWPLVVFSHGSCGIPTQSPFLVETLASRGFVVAAPNHPGNTTLDLPGCSSPAALADSFANRPADVRFVADEVRGGEGAAAPFAGRISRRRLGVAGHSFGGQTALRAAAEDRRMRAALALSPTARNIDELRIRTPAMVMTGSLDSVTPFDTDAVAAFGLLRGPRYLVKILDTGHCAFTLVCAPEFCGAGCEPPAISLRDAHAVTLRLAVPFLERWVRGRRRFARPLRAAAGLPGVEVETGRR